LGGVCFITDRENCGLSCIEMCQYVLRAGVRWVQYRDKDRSRLTMYRTALLLRELTKDFGATLIINDYPDIAASVDADGVHLGQEDLPVAEARKVMGKRKIVGVSTHNLRDAVRAEKEEADYIGFGPVFRTCTKAGAGRARGLGMLSRVSSKAELPVVAIGGINLERIGEVFSSGARAVAVASAILKDDVHYNASRFLRGAGGTRNRI